MHRNKAVFGPDADEFRPERWLIDDKEKLSFMNHNHLAVSDAGTSRPNATS